MSSFEEAFELTGHGKFNYIALIASGLVLLHVTIESTGAGFIIKPAKCELNMDSFDEGWVNSATFIGVLSSALLWGSLSDSLGRRAVVVPANVAACAASLASSFSNGFWMLFILRVLTGFMISAGSATIYVYLGELTTSRRRSATIAWSSSFISMAFLVLPLLAWAIVPKPWVLHLPSMEVKSWRIFMWFWNLPGLIATIILVVLPESPKFIFAMRSPEAALPVLATMYAWNHGVKKSDFPVQSITRDSRTTIPTGGFRGVIKNLMLILTPPLLRCVLISHTCMFMVFMLASGLYLWVPSIMDVVFKAKNLRKSICSIYNELNKDQTRRNECEPVVTSLYPYIITIGVVIMASYLAIGFVVNRFGRLKLYYFIVIFGSLMLSVIGVIPHTGVGIALLVLGLSAGCAASILAAIAVDVIPTSLRALTLCTMYMCGRLGAAAGAVVFGVGLRYICIYIFFIMGFLAIGNGVYNAALVCTCALILLAIGADLFGFTLVVTAAACDLDITVTEKGILTSLPFVGILLVSYFWGYVSDTRGRRFTLVLSMQVGFLLSSLSSLSPNWLVLACVKFFSVCFSCASNSAAYTLVGESCTPRMRNKYMLLMTCLLLFSPAAAAILTYPTLKLTFATPLPWLGIVFRPWRLLCIVLAIPSGLGAMGIYFFHESPKFLASQGRDEEALEVLRCIYAVNSRCGKGEFKVTSLQLSEQRIRPPGESLLRSMWEQSAPLFRPPLLKRTVQLFYIVAVVYITNNSFLVWLPHIMNELRLALLKNDGNAGNLCSLITSQPPPFANITVTSFSNSTEAPVYCHGTVEDNSLFTLIGSQIVFSFLNFVISNLPNKRRAVLITVLLLSSLGGILVNLMPEPISSVIFFIIFTCTCLGMGILASFFVDLYPTSYRGMVACLSIMVGRSSTFVGINLVGQLLFHHCTLTFYLWSILVFTSVIAAWFLPKDKPPEEEVTNL